MALKVSTGARQEMLKGNSLRDIFNRGRAVLKIYSGAAPSTADAAETGSLLVTITNASGAVGTQKIRFTPASVNNDGGRYFITLNGTAFSTVSDASATAVCTALYNLIENATNGSITTPAGRIDILGCDGKFTLTDNTGTLDVESASATSTFDYVASVTKVGGNPTFTAAVQTNDNGLRFEAAADVASGVIEKLATQTWSGVAAATGTAGYFRLIIGGDTGALSTSEVRLQGTVNTSNADLNMTKVSVTSGETHTVDTFQITFPAS